MKETYTASSNDLIHQPDRDCNELKKAIKVLTENLATLELEYADTEKIIRDFETQHTLELGDIISLILEQRRQAAEKNMTGDSSSKKYREEYEQAASDENEYKDSQKDSNLCKPPELDDDKKEQLKIKFRKIVNLTHPDKVIDEYKDKAKELFIKTKRARDLNNLDAIDKILDYVEQAKPFTLKEDVLAEYTALEAETKHLKYVIKELEEKIDSLKNSETYTTISGIVDWKEYFNETRLSLLSELASLQKQ